MAWVKVVWQSVLVFKGVLCVVSSCAVITFSFLETSEEFLFRGALQARLCWLLSPSWAVVVSLLVFGLWHIGFVAQGVGGNYIVGAAYSIVNQATIGLFFGLIFWRTRSLLACSIIHAFSDLL